MTVFSIVSGQKSWALLAAAALLCAATGCGEDGPERYHVSGKVTYNGAPVPAGRILFQPDAAEGNTGVAGHALIRDGHFDTSAGGGGTIGGPHVAVISGYDGKADQDLPLGQPLFNDQRVKLVIAQEKTTYDFALPAGQKR